MPFTVSCKECGRVLLNARLLVDANRFAYMESWYAGLYEKLKGHCPGCGRALPEPWMYAEKMRVEVSAVAQNNVKVAQGFSFLKLHFRTKRGEK